MTKFETDNEMEFLLKARQEQPQLYEQIPAARKIAVGIYEAMKTTATNGLTADEHLRLRGLKLSVAKDNLPPSERISKSLEILNLEKLIGANK
jgi:hypothetical protein